MSTNLPRVAAVVLMAGVVAAGCGPTAPPRGVVKGRVTLGKSQVTGATVFFENASAGVGMNAPLAADGSYEVRSYLGDGLPPGTYKVAVLPGGIMTPEEQGPKATEAKASRPKPNSAIPERYHKTSTSGLSVEVKEGDNPPFNFELAP